MMKKDTSPHVPQREKIKEPFQIIEFPWTEKQKQIIELILNKKNRIIFIEGPAGTSKTLLSVFCGLELLRQKRMSEIVYIRTVIESASKGMGFLPGESSDKLHPFIIPMEEKLFELLDKPTTEKLMKEKRIECIPVNFLRGRSLINKFIIADEAQNYVYKELLTTLTRIGKYSKLIVCGDANQSDVNGKSGFKTIMKAFNDEESVNNGIVCIQLTKDDIMREDIIKFIIDKLERAEKQIEPEVKKSEGRLEPMFPSFS